MVKHHKKKKDADEEQPEEEVNGVNYVVEKNADEPEEEEEDEAPKTDKHHSKFGGPQFWTMSEIFTILTALGSIASAVVGYKTVFLAQSSVDEIVSNWKASPITDIQLFPYSTTKTCPAGFAPLPTMTWPGTSVACGCPTGAKYKGSAQSSSASFSCSTNQTAAGCYTTPLASSVPLQSWKGSLICTRSLNSKPAVLGSDYTPRPIPPCSGDYHACGTGTYDKNYATCAPNTETTFPWPKNSSATGCPLTFMASTATLSLTPTIYENSFTANQFASAFANSAADKLFAAAGGDLVSGLPIVELSVAFSSRDKGPCFSDTNNVAVFSTTDQTAYASASDSAQTNYYPASCGSQDTRWREFDVYAEQSLLAENFASNTNSPCYGMTASEIKDSDYFTSGTICSNTKAKEGQQCLNGVKTSGMSCSDTPCKATFYQSKCGQVWAHRSTAPNNVGLFYRNQIYWSSTCPTSYKEVVNNQIPLQQAVQAQTALCIINIIFNCIIVISSIYFLCLECNGGYEAASVVDSKYTPIITKTIHMLALPPIIAALVLSVRVMDFFVQVSKNDCSDDTTNKAFGGVGTVLTSVVNSNTATIVLDLVQLIVIPLFLAIYHFCKHKKQKQQPEAVPTEEAAEAEAEAEEAAEEEEDNAMPEKEVELVANPSAVHAV